MKKTAYMLALAAFTAGISQASLLIDEDFTGVTASTSASAFSTATTGWFAGNNLGEIKNDEIQFKENDSATRLRAVGTWIDMSSYGTGTITVTFTVDDYANSSSSSYGFLQAVSGVDGSAVDVHSATTAVALSGGASNIDLDSESDSELYVIDEDGTVSVSFEITEDTEYLGILFGYYTPVSDSSAIYFSVDDVTVSIPEPATIGMLGLGAFVALTLRRRMM